MTDGRKAMEPQSSSESGESRQIHENTQNTSKFSRNLTKHMSVQHIQGAGILTMVQRENPLEQHNCGLNVHCTVFIFLEY